MAIEIDSTSKASSNTGNATLSWSHTLGTLGSTGLIIVCGGGEEISPSSGNQNITGITFNGVAMTLVAQKVQNDAHSTTTAMYELHGTDVPVAGTYTVIVSYQSANHDASASGCMSFKGIKNQVKEAVATAGNKTGGLSTSLTTLTDGALLVSSYSSQNTPNTTSSTGDTRAFSSVPGSTEKMETNGYYRIVTTAELSTVSLSGSNPETQALVIASFEASKSNGNFIAFF